MRKLARAYGRTLTTVFVSAAALWALLLIVLPQFNMLDMALRTPLRQLDSSIALTLMRDAQTCQTVLDAYRDEAPETDTGGLAVPSPLATPSPGGLAVPSPSGSGAGLPYIIQCDRATTAQPLVRDIGETAYLNTEYEIATLEVDQGADLETQHAQAQQVFDAASVLYQALLVAESDISPYGFGNFAYIVKPLVIPLSAEGRAQDRAEFSTQLKEAVGLRYERDGVVYERLTLTTLLRTIMFAAVATGLALVACYPIAYNLALKAAPERAVWLFVALLIPYATVEIMRVYAWVSIIDNNGLLNRLLDLVGVVDIERGEYVAFKRSPLTVFTVIVYTYILFMVFPIYNVMATLDRNQIEAARDLGSSTWRVHRRIIIPHSKPGIAVGCIATFMLAAGAFSVPRIVSSGLQGEWFSQTIYNKFFESQNTNLGTAYAFAYTVVCFAIVALFMWLMRARLRDFMRA
ncbi:MAG: ABC transporter permease [Alphaproteobacteria bacterium]